MPRIPRRLRQVAQLAVSAAGIAVIVRSVDLAALGRLLSSATPRLLVPAVLLGTISQAAAFPQWAVLLRDRSELGWRRLASVFLRATFIGQALPTGVGGDAVRAVEVGRRLGYGNAVGSLVASHLGWALGLVSMVLFAHALGAGTVGWQILALAVPLSLAATLLPISINGYGLREGIFVGVLAHSGVGAVASTALAVFADLQVLPVALVGGAVCLGSLGARRAAPAAVPAIA